MVQRRSFSSGKAGNRFGAPGCQTLLHSNDSNVAIATSSPLNQPTGDLQRHLSLNCSHYNIMKYPRNDLKCVALENILSILTI